MAYLVPRPKQAAAWQRTKSAHPQRTMSGGGGAAPPTTGRIWPRQK